MTNFARGSVSTATRWIVLFAIALMMAGILQLLHLRPVFADSGGYPWYNATYIDANYDWGYKPPCPSSDPNCTQMSDNGYGTADPWGYDLRNCTSYVAWKINQVFGVNNISGWGDAATWYKGNTKPQTYPVYSPSSYTPQVGDIAQWNSPSPWGHVAYVYAVNNGIASLDEYNSGYPRDRNGKLQWGLFYSGRTTASNSAGTPDHYIHIGTVPTQYPGTANLIKNGDFGLGGSYWSRSGNSTNFSVLTNSGGTTPYEGNQYMASNTQDAGGSVYQDVPLTINAGDTICASVMFTTYGTGSGSSGNVALWINGQGSEIQYSNLPGNDVWTPFKVCNTASSATSSFRFQIYPGVGSPTVGVDTIDANKSLVKNGDFGLGGNYWSRIGNSTNFSVLNSSGGTTPYEGNQYMASNTQDAGGSVYQDVPLTINSDDTICARTMLTTYGTGSGSSGYVYLWINGQNSSIRYSNLPGANVWTPYEVCITASSSASTFRYQIYPDVGSPTVGVDTIDANKSLVKNGDFGLGGNYWSRIGNSTNFSVLNSSGGTTPYEGNQYMASNTQDAGGSVYQDVPLTINTGDTICASVMLTTYGTGSGSSGNVSLWINGQGSAIHYSNLPGNNVWVPYRVCNTASTSASSFRFQIYPNVGAPTVGVDTIDDGM